MVDGLFSSGLSRLYQCRHDRLNGVYFGAAGVVIILMLFTLFVGEPTQRMLQKEAQQRHNKVVGSKVVAWFSVTAFRTVLRFL